MQPVWLDLGEGKSCVLAGEGDGLFAWLMDYGAMTGCWALPARSVGQIAAILVNREIWAAVPGPGRVNLVRGWGKDWWQRTLELDTDPRVMVGCPALVSAGGEVRLLAPVVGMEDWSLWYWRLSLDGRELTGALLDAGTGGRAEPGLSAAAVADLAGWLHLFYLQPEGAKRRLAYRLAVPPDYAWSPAGFLSGPAEDCGEPAVLLDARGILHVLWPAGKGDGGHLLYRNRSRGSWPGGRWEAPLELTRLSAPPRGILLLEQQGEIIAAWESGGRWWYKALPGEGIDPRPWPGEKPQLMRQGWGGPAPAWANFLPGSGSPPRPVALPASLETESIGAVLLAAPCTMGQESANPPAVGLELLPELESLPSLAPITDWHQARELASELRHWRRVLRETAWQLERLHRRHQRLEARRKQYEEELTVLQGYEERLEEFLQTEVQRLAVATRRKIKWLDSHN